MNKQVKRYNIEGDNLEDIFRKAHLYAAEELGIAPDTAKITKVQVMDDVYYLYFKGALSEGQRNKLRDLIAAELDIPIQNIKYVGFYY